MLNARFSLIALNNFSQLLIVNANAHALGLTHSFIQLKQQQMCEDCTFEFFHATL